jgi:hypothetical protein
MNESPSEQALSTIPPIYEPPQVLSYREEEIAAMLGPAQACSFGHSVIECGSSPGAPRYPYSNDSIPPRR